MVPKKEASKSAGRKGIRARMGEEDSRAICRDCAGGNRVILETDSPIAARYKARAFWTPMNEFELLSFTEKLAVDFIPLS
jgi:hypothetical protein